MAAAELKLLVGFLLFTVLLGGEVLGVDVTGRLLLVAAGLLLEVLGLLDEPNDEDGRLELLGVTGLLDEPNELGVAGFGLLEPNDEDGLLDEPNEEEGLLELPEGLDEPKLLDGRLELDDGLLELLEGRLLELDGRLELLDGREDEDDGRELEDLGRLL